MNSVNCLILDMWNDGFSVNEIEKVVPLVRTTIFKVLKKWVKLGKCDYNEYISKCRDKERACLHNKCKLNN